MRGWHLEASNRLSPGGAWPDPTGWVWPPAILNVTVPPGLIATRAGLPLVGGGAVDLLAALGLAEGAAEEREAGGTDVKQWQPRWRIVPGGSRLTGSTVWPAMTCVGVAFQRKKVRPQKVSSALAPGK